MPVIIIIVIIEVHYSDILSINDTKFIRNKIAKILFAEKSVINIDKSTLNLNTIMVQPWSSISVKWI